MAADFNGDGRDDIATPNEASNNVSILLRRQTFRRGDVSADAAVNISDAIYVLTWLFPGGPPPPCMESAETNNDGAVDLSDAIYLLEFLFQGGPPPPEPGPHDCGPDPKDRVADFLGCIDPASCS